MADRNGNSGAVVAEKAGSSRRQFLTGVGAAGVAALFPGRWMAQGGAAQGVAASGLIDVHNHFIPPSVIPQMDARALGPMATWTASKTLEAMDRSGVATAFTSVAPAGGDALTDPNTAVKLAREYNDYGARLAADYPKRFGMFTNVPLPNIDATLKEIEYGYDTLKADGVAMFTNYGDKFLGDPLFNPVFEELNRRKAVVYTHPQTATCCTTLTPGIGYTAIEFGTNTTRALALYVFGGAAARYPNVKMIWSHGGGTMPYLVQRFTLMAQGPQQAPKFPQGFLGVAGKFYYDTAFVSNEASMLALRKVVPMSQIVFGTDNPYRSFADNIKDLDGCGVFSADELRMIHRENAAPLFPRLKA